MSRGCILGIARILRSRAFISLTLSLVILLIAASVVAASNDDDEDEDATTFKDFNMNVGDRIDLEDYQMELLEIQSVRDGLAVMRVSKVGGSLDEQRVLLLDSPNNFEGGAEDRGFTITVADILDEGSARIRVEYQQALGTARKRTSTRPATIPDRPMLQVTKSFDRSQINVGDEVEVSISVKNTGTGQAIDIDVQDTPPLPEFTYLAGYPPRIRESLDPGESDSAVYVINAVKEGSIRVPGVIVTYTDSKKNARSNGSEPFNVVIDPRSRALLRISANGIGPLALGEERALNVSITNEGTAPATRIKTEGSVSPSVGLTVSGLEESLFEIAPGESASLTARVSGSEPGEYNIGLKASYEGGDGAMVAEGSTRLRILEREYKYEYLLLTIPIAIIIAWIYRRHREYKY